MKLCGCVKYNPPKGPPGVILSKGNTSMHTVTLVQVYWSSDLSLLTVIFLIMLTRPFHLFPLTLIHCQFQLRVIITLLPA